MQRLMLLVQLPLMLNITFSMFSTQNEVQKNLQKEFSLNNFKNKTFHSVSAKVKVGL